MNNSDFEKAIKYRFKDHHLLSRALTHSSYGGCGKSTGNNERLEFLGDAFFDAIISEYLYNAMKDVEEGHLTKMRALIVCKHSLAKRGMELGINNHLKLGKGEEQSCGRYRESIIADAMEAVIGAVFLDGGWESVRSMVLNVFETTIEEALSGKLHSDYKTTIQEKLQAVGITDIKYLVDKEEGPDHDKVFHVTLWAGGRKIGQGVGNSKKEAEQNAAKAALVDDDGVGHCF
ncbi:MAG: ribonuclease III [Anaerovoracaceae bacterium]